MMFATTRVRLGPGTDQETPTDEYGDPIAGAPNPLQKPVPAALTEKSRVVMDETTGSPRTIHYAILRLSPNAGECDVNTLVEDVRTGKVWIVEEKVGPARTIAGADTLTFNLKLNDTAG